MIKVVWPKPPSATLGRQLAPAMLALALLVFPAYAADVVWHDMSNQEQEEWVIRWDIPGSVRHSMERRSIQGAEQRQGTRGAQQRAGTRAAQDRHAVLAAGERRGRQGADERRAGYASERTYQYVEERTYRPLGYYGSVRQDSRR